MSRAVEEFFDDEATRYFLPGDNGMAQSNRYISARIEESIEGKVLCVGGLWARSEKNPAEMDVEITIVDVSQRMVDKWENDGFKAQRADARALPFDDGSFDRVVFPLVLHHIVGRNGPDSQDAVAAALREGHRVLRSGGRILISDFSIPRPLYGMELRLAPVTRALLALARIPLVVMHTADFFVSSLRQTGHVDVGPEWAPRSGGAMGLVRPVIGLSWLRVPRFLYPVRGILVSARKPLTSPRR